MGGKLRLENLKLFDHLIDYQKIGKKAEANENRNEQLEKRKKTQNLQIAEYERNKLTHVNTRVPYPHGGRSYENEPNDHRSHRA
jgi:hypothetical protein